MAGVLPYTWHQGIVYVMISEENGGRDRGKWDHFSGQIDKTDRTNRDAAAREGAEESCELFGNASALHKQIVPLNKSESFFLLEVVNPQFRSIAATFQSRKAMKRFKASKYQEKSKVRWIPLTLLINAANKHSGTFTRAGKTITLRPYFTRLVVSNRANFINKFAYLQGRV